MASTAWLQFQRVLEEPDEFGFEPKLRRRWAPAPTPPRIPTELMGSDGNVVEQDSVPPSPRAAVDEDGSGDKKYTDAEQGDAKAPSDEDEKLLRRYAATEVALSESSDDNSDNNDNYDDDDAEQASDGVEARFVLQSTAGRDLTAATVEDDNEGIVDLPSDNATLKHIEIVPPDNNKVNTCALLEQGPAEPPAAIPPRVISEAVTTAVKQDLSEEKAGVGYAVGILLFVGAFWIMLELTRGH